MDIFMLTSTCPYYGDEEIIGIYSDKEKLEQAKEIIVRCSGIDDYANRLSVNKFTVDKMPYDFTGEYHAWKNGSK